jgi:GTP-binding protein HflX
VVILGYTNVGKSSLFNRITGSDVVAEDRLFATLDPFQRRVMLPSMDGAPPFETVISDTVGFIRDLPEELRTAFRATLEELYDASLLLHVIDATDSAVRDRKEAVDRIVAEMELGEAETVVVVNKIDAAEQESVEALCREFGALPVSARTGEGVSGLLGHVRRHLTVPSGWTRPPGLDDERSADAEETLP